MIQGVVSVESQSATVSLYDHHYLVVFMSVVGIVSPSRLARILYSHPQKIQIRTALALAVL